METSILAQHARGNWVRLQTLLTLRWCAIAGQIITILVAEGWYGLRLANVPVGIVIGASVMANIVTHLRFPQAKRLSEGEARAMMVFDILQLALLLYLTLCPD